MKNIKILHLYSKALDLYGDYKNLYALCKRIEETGNFVVVDNTELFEEINTDGYDMVYIGHGKSRNLEAVAKHFIAYTDKIKNSIENGQIWLATGNSRELFGKNFTNSNGKKIDGIGLFDYKGIETNKVFVSDMKAVGNFGDKQSVYCFANRTAYLEGKNLHPLFKVETGFCDGNDFSGFEGTLYKNFFATWSMGPVLVRNPSLMKEILKRLLNEDYKECDFSLEQQALDLVLTEFKKG